ncbi:MAG: hypothetical protein LBG81_09125 [Coriobacteriaceae bacterium]|nr:hypothetical protein [Coriobacteriaceae bacterium]
MDSESAYIKVYEILDKYYFVTDEYYDQLGNMLSDMMPGEFGAYGSFSSLDRAVYSDWEEAWEEYVGIGQKGTPEQVFRVAKTIIDYYSLEVEYELGNAEEYLKEQLLNG